MYYVNRETQMNLKLKLTILEKFSCQADFARMMGISETTLSRIIRGRQNASPELKRIISEGLGIKASEIFQVD
jgi:transcriptional regulator with XRE-family HTH domain